MNAEIHHLPFVAVGRPAEAIATAHPNSANAPEAAPSSRRAGGPSVPSCCSSLPYAAW